MGDSRRVKILKKVGKISIINPRLLFLLILGALTLYFLFVTGFRVYRDVLSVKSYCSSCDSNVLIQRDSGKYTLLVVESENEDSILGIWMIASNAISGASIVIYIPPGVYVPAYETELSNYVSVGDLRYAGDLISKGRGVLYSLWQVENYIGLVPENYIYLTSKSVKEFNDMFGDIRDFDKSKFEDNVDSARAVTKDALVVNSLIDRFNITNLILNSAKWSSFVRNLDTSIKNSELIPELLRMKGVFEGSKSIYLDLSGRWAVSEQEYNSREIYVPNYEEIDSGLSEYVSIYRSREIERELAKVEIYNGSDTSGLAFRFARKVQNNGIKVVRYDNSPEKVGRTVMYVTDLEKFNFSYKLTRELVSLDAEIIEGRPEFITTGDIVVILGKDLDSIEDID